MGILIGQGALGDTQIAICEARRFLGCPQKGMVWPGQRCGRRQHYHCLGKSKSLSYLYKQSKFHTCTLARWLAFPNTSPSLSLFVFALVQAGCTTCCRLPAAASEGCVSLFCAGHDGLKLSHFQVPVSEIEKAI